MECFDFAQHFDSKHPERAKRVEGGDVVMERHFDEELKGLHKELLKMAVLAQEAIYKSIEALKNRDKSHAQDVIDKDDKIDELELEIDERCID